MKPCAYLSTSAYVDEALVINGATATSYIAECNLHALVISARIKEKIPENPFSVSVNYICGQEYVLIRNLIS